MPVCFDLSSCFHVIYAFLFTSTVAAARNGPLFLPVSFAAYTSLICSYTFFICSCTAPHSYDHYNQIRVCNVVVRFL
jgi:hypothetical protein